MVTDCIELVHRPSGVGRIYFFPVLGSIVACREKEMLFREGSIDFVCMNKVDSIVKRSICK